MKFAEHRSNGFMVDLVRDGLDFSVESISGINSKDWERFRKERDSTKKYVKVLGKVCEAIVKEIFSIDDGQESEQDLANIAFFCVLIKECLGYYSQYKSYFETLGASQKQLDFISASVFFIPFVAHAIADSTTSSERNFQLEPFIIDRILPSDSKSAIAKYLSFVECRFLAKNPTKSFKSSLKEILDKEKIIGYDSINKDIDNWLNGKNPPSLEHIKIIAKIGEYCENLSNRQIEVLLKIAKVIQSLYGKAKEYFGVDLADLLVEHFRLVSIIDFQQMVILSQTKDIVAFEAMIDAMSEKLPKSTSITLRKYLYFYFSNPFFDFCLHKFGMEGKYSAKLKQQEKEYFKNIQEFVTVITQIDEKKFFDNVDFFLPVRYFVPQNTNDFDVKDWQAYFNDRVQSFLKPSEANIPDKELLEKCLNANFMQYAKLIKYLLPLTLPTKEKQPNDEINFEKALQKVQEKYDISEDPYICFMQARFYAQKLELDKANEYYLKALKYGKNIIGGNVKFVIKEGLIVSARLTDKKKLDLNNAKSDFTKFYKEAVFLNLISNLFDDNHFSQHFLLDEQKKFEGYFCHLYPSATMGNSVQSQKYVGILVDKKSLKMQKKLKKFQNPSFTSITPNFFMATKDKLENIKIDFKNPNKLLTQYPNLTTQLMHCCLMKDIESVKKLLEAGADVNILGKSDNSSVLFYCISGMSIPLHIQTAHIEIAKLLIPKCSKETLNARLIKRRETILSLCIERGLVELVKLLIENGVDLESKTCSMDDMSPLYWCISQIAVANEKVYLGYGMNNLTEQQIKNLVGISSNATFDDEYFMDFEKQKAQMVQDTQRQTIMTNYHKQNLANYYQIFDLLVEHCDKVDIIQENLYNFTPLIYATKIDEPILVEKLLAKGADKTLKLDDGKTAYDYAEKNHNVELMIKLRH
ncbi:ankyrin repeat domain-containing protein [Helicobacter sp. 23-1048]